MNCPKCKSNLDGGLIYDTFLQQFGNEAKALETAAMYGATKTEGRWQRQTGLYDMNLDRTTAWRCPDCGHEWRRE